MVKKQVTLGMFGELMNVFEVVDVFIFVLDFCYFDVNVSRCLIGKQGFKGQLGFVFRVLGFVNV